VKDYGLKEIDITDKAKIKAVALQMSDDGFCAHYAGYTCDKDFPKVCPKCIERWVGQYIKVLKNK
jgi:hypothetical protein